MPKAPTYSPKEIKALAMTINDAEAMKVLAILIDEEMELYNEEDMLILLQASMMIFAKSLIMGSIKLLPL